LHWIGSRENLQESIALFSSKDIGFQQAFIQSVTKSSPVTSPQIGGTKMIGIAIYTIGDKLPIINYQLVVYHLP